MPDNFFLVSPPPARPLLPLSPLLVVELVRIELLQSLKRLTESPIERLPGRQIFVQAKVGPDFGVKRVLVLARELQKAASTGADRLVQ